MTHTARDWYGESLLITPVDALDTLVIMGLTDEASAARRLIDGRLSFDKDVTVKNFEITIRVLGGLLSGYQMTGDVQLLHLADDLGARLLPVFASPTGMPYMYVNLKTGKTSGAKTNPAEIGTLRPEIIESAWYLRRATGDAQYLAMGKAFFDALIAHTRTDDGFTVLTSVEQWPRVI